MKLDSKFKKIASDDAATTLRHKDGHEIRIAHRFLSKANRAELDKLPHYDDGGDVDDRAPASAQASAPMDFSSNLLQYKPELQDYPSPLREPPQPVKNEEKKEVKKVRASKPQVAAPDTEEIPENQTQTVAPTRPVEQPDIPIDDSQAPDQQQPQSRPQAGPSDAPPLDPIEKNAQDFEVHKQKINQELNAEDQAWQQDLHNGHIAPETYQSLFAKKDTLGKIGTLFGLMAGGFGAGLSHQPNALLEQMNKEIQNDLEAQKQSKGNAQNFVKLENEHQMQMAQMKRLGVENQLTQSLIGKTGAETQYSLAQIDQLQKQGQLTMAQAQAERENIKLRQAEERNIGAEVSIKTDTLAHTRANRAMLAYLAQQIQKYPEGSKQRQDNEAAFAMLSQQVDLMNSDISAKAAGAAAMAHTIYGSPSVGEDGLTPEEQFKRRQNMLPMMGPAGSERQKYNEEHHFPGLNGQSSQQLNSQDREQINSGLQFDQQLNRFMKWTKQHSGDLRPDERNFGMSLANQLSSAYRGAIDGGVYKKSEQNFLNQVIDEDPTKFFNSIRVMPKLQALAIEHRHRLNQLLTSKGFDSYRGEQGGQDNAQTATKDGVNYKKVPGGWQRIK